MKDSPLKWAGEMEVGEFTDSLKGGDYPTPFQEGWNQTTSAPKNRRTQEDRAYLDLIQSRIILLSLLVGIMDLRDLMRQQRRRS
jgi:hypothetical protein